MRLAEVLNSDDSRAGGSVGGEELFVECLSLEFVEIGVPEILRGDPALGVPIRLER